MATDRSPPPQLLATGVRKLLPKRRLRFNLNGSDSKAEISTYFNVCFMVPTGFLILAFAGRGAAGLGYFFVFTGTVVLSNIVTVVAHELGHATLAHLVGMRVVAITIGSGPPLTSGRWRDV